MSGTRRSGGFTMIEMLTVVVIIMLVMALAMPDFVHMMKERRWSLSIASIQALVMRTRALATNIRQDFSVEFRNQGDNGTTMWIEAENSDLETIPDLPTLAQELGGYTPIFGFMKTVFWNAGGRYTGSPPNVTNITYNPANADASKYADNTRQSEIVTLSPSITVDVARCSNFISWDATNPNCPYGRDDYPDIRIGPNGALAQSLDPVICLKIKGAEERRAITVVRCTGRVIGGVLP